MVETFGFDNNKKIDLDTQCKQTKTKEKVCALAKAYGTSSSKERGQLIDPTSPFQLATRIARTPLFIGKAH